MPMAGSIGYPLRPPTSFLTVRLRKKHPDPIKVSQISPFCRKHVNLHFGADACASTVTVYARGRRTRRQENFGQKPGLYLIAAMRASSTGTAHHGGGGILIVDFSVPACPNLLQHHCDR